VAVILFLAWQIDRSKKRTEGFWFMCRTMLSLLPIVGLVGSNNLSTAIIILGIGVILIFASNPKYMQFIGLGSAGIGFVAIFLAIGWNVWQSGKILRNMRKDSRRFRDCMRSEAAGFLAGDLETVFRSWALFRKRRMI
jgi:cell division protein FtsW